MICHNLQELAGGKSGPSGLRRSSERSDVVENRNDRQSSNTSGKFVYIHDMLVEHFGNNLIVSNMRLNIVTFL